MKKMYFRYNNSSRYMLSVLEGELTGSLLLTEITGNMEVGGKTHQMPSLEANQDCFVLIFITALPNVV